jgi:Lrp/AsnC family transcriptional regulator, leucine-responsive regulatory protein
VSLEKVLPPKREGTQWSVRTVLAHPLGSPQNILIRVGTTPGGSFLGSPMMLAMLDARDLEIVAALQEDGRATYSEVARRVGLSASSVHDRVRKLEQLGVIRGYRAEIDAEAVGLYVTAIVAVMPLDPKQPDDLPDRVVEFSEVEDCLSVAGEANYILKVRTRTTSDLEDLLRRMREKAGVQTRTTVVLSTPFEDRPLAP